MSQLQIITLDEAKERIIEMLDYDLMNNYYFKFDEWCIDENVRIKEVLESQEDDRMKEEYLRS